MKKNKKGENLTVESVREGDPQSYGLECFGRHLPQPTAKCLMCDEEEECVDKTRGSRLKRIRKVRA